MADKDYNVYQGDDGKWRGERQDASRASVVADTQKVAFAAYKRLSAKSQVRSIYP